jgi:ankyrin repeat protein
MSENEFMEAVESKDLNKVMEMIGAQSQSVLNKALHASASRGYVSFIKILANHGADVNTRNQNGVPALRAAIFQNNIRSVQMLLSLGADKSINVGDGTIIEYTREHLNDYSAMKFHHNLDVSRIAMVSYFVYCYTNILKMLESNEAIEEPEDLRDDLDLDIFMKCDPVQNNNSEYDNNASNGSNSNTSNNNVSNNNVVLPIITPAQLEKMPAPADLPTKCFDPTMFNEDTNITDASTTFYTFDTNNQVLHVACLDDQGMEFYKNDRDYLYLKCKPHVPLTWLHVGIENTDATNPIRRLPFKANVYVKNNEFYSVNPGKKYALIPTNQTLGQIISFKLSSGENNSAVSSDHCQFNYPDRIHQIKEIVPVTGGKRKTYRRKLKRRKTYRKRK